MTQSIYLVGGAVRDQLLGRDIKERDWVVVGSTPEAMLSQGFQQVGKDFPVFIHPKTGEEYALARTERKSGKGYTGFTTYSAPDVTLEEDLLRRDLTINAMAQKDNGEIVDPFHGQDDLKKKCLRHVSPAFVEDPLRVLRIARFAARFGDFTIAPETLTLMKTIVANGEMETLTPERVWREWEKALTERNPERFLEVLLDCDAVFILFPELKPHYDTCLSLLADAATEHEAPLVRFSVFFYPVPFEPDAIAFFKRYKVPQAYQHFTRLLAHNFEDFKRALRAPKITLELFLHLDALRRTERFIEWCEAASLLALCQDQTPMHETDQWLMDALSAVQSVKIDTANLKGKDGKTIAEAYYEARLKAIALLT